MIGEAILSQTLRSAPFETPPATAPQDKGGVSKHAASLQPIRHEAFTAMTG